MAAYQTQQINVGSIAAPDVGSVFANFADRLQKQQSNQLDNIRQAAQYDRQQVLNQRADQEWNRQQGVYKAKADVAADFAANQFADRYTGTNKVNNDAVVNAYVKYVENGGEMTDDLNKRVQALTEQNRGFQEDATPAIAQELVKRSNGAISMTDAMSEAKGIAMGLPSRVAQQELADKETKRQQDYQDMMAKNNLEKFKMQAEIAKDNQEGRYKDAELKFKQFQAMYGGGTGGSGGGAHGPVSYMDTTSFLDSAELSPYGTGWVPGSDKSDAYAAMNANKADNVPAPVTLQALKNSILTNERGSTFDMAKFKSETDRLKGTYVDPKTVNTFKEIQAPTDEQWQSTVPKYVDRTIIGATPNTAEARARLVVPELFRGDPNKVVEETKVSNPTVANTNTNKYDGNYNTAVKKIETGSKDGDYSNVNKIGAMGAYQFTPSTLEYVNKITGKDISKDEFLKNPQIQDEYFKVLTDANKNVLSQRGIAPTDFNVWAAHNLGAGSVRKLLDTSTPADPVLARYIESNLPKGIEPTKENYINYYAPKFGTTIADVTNKSNVGVNPLIERNAVNREKALGLDWSQQVVPAVEQVGGIGNREVVKTPEQKTQRIAEINQMLGSNPAINDEIKALIDERASLQPKKNNLEAVQREILNPLSAMLPATSVTKIPGIVENVGSKIHRYLNPMTDVEYARSVEGLGKAEEAARREVARGIAENAPIQLAEREAVLQARNQTKPTPDQIAEAKSMLAKKIEAINGKAVAKQAAFKNGANDYWNILIQQRQAGLIDDAQLMKEMRMINDTGLISTRNLMESLDKIGFRR